ncbi:MAG TPA: thiamine-phosphate kinase [Bacteroidales bacterium]|nr:thiamine-phosphate kinase [Bacteroidales bacterium]
MENSKNTLTLLSELGEFGLIDRLTNNIPVYHKSTVKGVGDDAAVLDYNGTNLLVTSDMLMEGIHFDLVYTPLKHLGYKAAVVNFSDIFAMNAKPRQLLISIALSKKFTIEALDQFYEGLRLACETYEVDLVGGDTSSSLTGLAISITVIGEAEKDKITYRSGAKDNDLICVSGDLGGAYMGLQILEREKNIYQESKGGQPSLDNYEYVLKRQLRPEARKDIVDFFHKNNIQPTSMIDISDGLSSEVLHICKQSNAGCKLYSHKIPIDDNTIDACKELNMEPLICALNGGEDYELLFTLPMANFDIIAARNDVSIIGHITDKSEGCNLVTEQNQQIPLIAQGWNAYGK